MPVIGIIIFVLFIIILGLTVGSKNISRKVQSPSSEVYSPNDSNNYQPGGGLYLTRLMTTDPWWTGINNGAQLKLAIELAERTLPVWDLYASKDSLQYVENVNESGRAINTNLLFDSLEQIKLYMHLLAGKDDRRYAELKQYHDQFISPVMALTDGHWKLPYEVKKVFYAVFQILKGIIDDDNPITNIEFSNSINNSLEVIDIADLLSEKQVHDILEPYKDKLVVQKHRAQPIS